MMSVNCMRCGFRDRTGIDLLCDDCRLIKRLPTTADGVPIVPGMTIQLVDIDEKTLSPFTVVGMAQDEQMRNENIFVLKEVDGRIAFSCSCFSTSEAAAKAKSNTVSTYFAR